MDVLRSFRRRPLRTALLLVQVFLGTLIMTLALSAALGSRAPAAPPERFDVWAGHESEDGSSQSYAVFRAGDVPELLDLAPDALHLAVVGELYEPVVVVGNTRYALRAGAQVSAGFFGLEPPRMVRGTVFTDAEIRGEEKVALLSVNAARALFGDADPVGRDLNLEIDDFNPDTPPAPPTPYRVVGLFEPPPTDDPYSGGPALYLPFPNADDPGVQPAGTLAVRAEPGRREAAQAQLLSAVRRLYKAELEEQGAEEGRDFTVREPGDTSPGPEGIDFDLLTFGLFGAVALVVSSIGIFSATVVEAEERTHEIGVRRALGASAARVGWSLVARALGVALLGGLLGVLGAALLIPVLQGPARDAALFGGTRLTFSPLAALVALGAVVGVSGLLGLVPALRVGRLKPVQALRESV